MGAKLKLYYLSHSSFSQVDLSILHHLCPQFEVTYGVIIPSRYAQFSRDELIDYCKKHEIKLHLFEFKRRERDIRIAFEFFEVLSCIRNANPDIIYTFSFDNPLQSILAPLLDVKKTIVFIHDVQFHSSHDFAFFFRIGRWLVINYFRSFHLFSKNQEQIFNARYKKQTIYTIPLGMTDFGESASDGAKEAKALKKITRFLFFGNILPYKRLDILLDATELLTEHYSNFELVVAGRCPNWEVEYQRRVEGKRNIIPIIRYIRNSEIADLFESCHYLVLPYMDATQSGPLMIGYNYGIPAIATRIEAFSETVQEGASGFFFNVNDARDLARVMAGLIDLSAGEYAQLVRSLKSYADENFSSVNVARKYATMFSDHFAKMVEHSKS